MFVLNCLIQIGNIQFKAVHNLKIIKSIHTINQIATIQLPLTARLVQSNSETLSVETAKVFKIGDKIEIYLGYNNRLIKEYQGYIKSINYKQPLEIECDNTYFMRLVNIKQSWSKISLNEICRYLASKVDLDILNEIPELTIYNFISDDKTVFWLFNELKNKYGLTIFLENNKIYCGLLYGLKLDEVKYQFDFNVINTDELKWINEDEIKLKIRAISFEKNGDRIEATIGNDEGEIRTLYFYDVKDLNSLKTLAQSEMNRCKYSGYRGRIETFLEPFAQPCMLANIIDTRFKDRSGIYYIEEVETTFGQNGARRKITLGYKI